MLTVTVNADLRGLEAAGNEPDTVVLVRKFIDGTIAYVEVMQPKQGVLMTNSMWKMLPGHAPRVQGKPSTLGRTS